MRVPIFLHFFPQSFLILRSIQRGIYLKYTYGLRVKYPLFYTALTFNPLNAELNPICHLLVFLGDLTFMVPCIVSIFQYIYPTRCNVTQFIYIWKLLYMFRVVLPPIIRSAYNCTYSIWYLSHRYCYLPLSVGTGLSVLCVAYATHSTLKQVPTFPRKRQIAVTVWQIPDAVDTVVCAPDDGWKYHPKYVEQFPDINKLCKVASCWIYIGILLGAHPFLHISRIRVKNRASYI
jgi:hypothetical protein